MSEKILDLKFFIGYFNLVGMIKYSLYNIEISSRKEIKLFNLKEWIIYCKWVVNYGKNKKYNFWNKK